MDRVMKVTVKLDNGHNITVQRTVQEKEIKKLEKMYKPAEMESVLVMVCMREAMGAASQAVQVMSETFPDWWDKKGKL